MGTLEKSVKSFAIYEKQVEQLKKFCEITEMSESEVVREALTLYFSREMPIVERASEGVEK